MPDGINPIDGGGYYGLVGRWGWLTVRLASKMSGIQDRYACQGAVPCPRSLLPFSWCRTSQLYSVKAASATVGYVCGASGQLNSTGGSATIVLKTTDAGRCDYSIRGQGLCSVHLQAFASWWQECARLAAGLCMQVLPGFVYLGSGTQHRLQRAATDY